MIQTKLSTQTQEKSIIWHFINSLIGLVIMFGFRFLPTLYPITPVRMEVVGISLGMIYLWTTVDPIWSSLIGAVALGFSSYAPMNQVLMNFLGDPTVIQTIFITVFIGAIVQSGLTEHIGRWFLTRNIIKTLLALN